MQVSKKSALHCAMATSNLSVLHIVLGLKPNLEIKVNCVSVNKMSHSI